MESLKQKLSNVLHSKHFCGLCMETGEMSMLNEHLDIIVNKEKLSKTLRSIIEAVFSNTYSLVTNSQICNICKEKLIHAYIFIQNTIERSRIMIKLLHELYSIAEETNENLSGTQIEHSNVVIVLANNVREELSKEKNINMKKIKDEETEKRKYESEKDILKPLKMYECSKCNIKMASFREWKLHKIQMHKKKIFRCNSCFKTFSTKQYLIAHHKVHSKVQCKLCNKIISHGKFNEHMKFHHGDSVNKCEMCNIVYYTETALKSHEKMSHPSKDDQKEAQCIMCLKNFDEHKLKIHKCKFDCPECNVMPCIHYKYLMSYREQFLNHAIQAKCLDCDYACRKKELLIGHVNREHLGHHPYSCDKCGQQFYSKVMVKTHIYRFHHEINVCVYCDSEYRSKSTFESHKKGCEVLKRDILCDICPTSFDNDEELEEHKKRRHSKQIFPCEFCKKQFLKESKLKEHMVKVHCGLQNKNRLINVDCIVCLEKFGTKGELIQHMKSHGPNTKYLCRLCNVEYDTVRQYRAHNRKHIGPFATCQVCGKDMRKILLKNHMNSHSDVIVTCETCGKSFQNVTLLKSHQKVHLQSVPCPKCEKLINPAKLRRHYKAHLINEDPVLKIEQKQKASLNCGQCDYKTWNNILLECHMNRYHLKIKPYVCHVCSKDFIGKHLLKKHLETHTLEKSIPCTICHKSFRNSACLKMHLRLHTGERPYACEICGDTFRSSSILNVHKLKKHSEKKNECPLCSNKFHTVRDLRRHVINVHWKQKDKRFNPRELKGLGEEHYHLFHDGRRVKVAEDDVDFYVPAVELR